MSTPLDGYCGMPSCMRLALAREHPHTPISILRVDDLAWCIVWPAQSTGLSSVLIYAGESLASCTQPLTCDAHGLSHTCIRSEIRRMLIGRELFKESAPA